jgi:hypothetical protein
MPDDVYVKIYDRQDQRLGRQVVHDERSRAFAHRVAPDGSIWRNRSIRVYDPSPNPNQCHGECTFVSKVIQFNSAGNRVSRRILGMDTVHKGYRIATSIDPWDGAWEPDDTGSSGLAASKAAQQLGLGGEYRWFFGYSEEIVTYLMQPDAIPVSVGTEWHENMFEQDRRGKVSLGGGIAGGHQWTIRGYDVDRDEVIGRCWWGDFRDFRLARADLDTLLHADGDAHIQKVLQPA